MKKVDLIFLMEKYNITLRRLSNGYWETTSYDGESELSSKYEVIIQDVGQKISEDCFWKLYSKSKGFFIKNGRLMRYMKRRFIPRTPGWIAKIDSSHGNIQLWSKKRDYYGKSAEEAIYSLLKSNNLL